MKLPTRFETAFCRYSRLPEYQPKHGGAGTVVICADESGEKRAIKVLTVTPLSRDKLRRFKNEIEFCRKFRHRNVLAITDHGLLDNEGRRRPFYVMPFCPETLDAVTKAGDVEPAQKLLLFGKILAAMEAVHSEGCAHRDLKPANILLDAEGEPIIADFGVALLIEEYQAESVVTGDKAWLANRKYASPEQRRNQPGDRRSDVYSLGLMLNEMFTGVPPEGRNPKRIGDCCPEWAELDHVADSMREFDPEKRPTARRALDELQLAMGRVARSHAHAQKLAEIRSRAPNAHRLAVEPMRIVEIGDWKGDHLELVLNHDERNLPLEFKNWKNYFRSPPATSYTGDDPISPRACRFVGNKLLMPLRDKSNLEQHFGLVKGYLATANQRFAEYSESQAQAMREAMDQELAEEASRQRDTEGFRQLLRDKKLL